MVFSHQTKTTAVIAFLGGMLPLALATPGGAQQVNFSDVGSGYWARPFIERLAQEDIIAGFPDGTFKPNDPVTRAQFAAIIRQAFDQPVTRGRANFSDVRSNYWAARAIADAYATGFMSGYPDGSFQPNQQIPRVQALVSIANGLNIDPGGSINAALRTYRDADDIPNYAEDEVAAATQNGMVVSYPNVNYLRPQRIATRADVAAFIYQAMVSEGRFSSLGREWDAASYVVNAPPVATTHRNSRRWVSAGTQLEVGYPEDSDASIVVAPGQTVVTTLEVVEPIRNDRNQILVPEGSTIQGRIVPVDIQGASITAAKFVADTIVVHERTHSIDAESRAIAATNSPASESIQGALVTAAAESILDSITGDRSLGSLIRDVITADNRVHSRDAVIVIDPRQLDLRLESDLHLAAHAED